MAAIAVESAVRRRMPPVTEIGAASMTTIAAGVIYLAAYLPKHAPLEIAVALLAFAAALQVLNAFIAGYEQGYRLAERIVVHAGPVS